jgi:hypothetical protein
MINKLRPYQLEAGTAILKSVYAKKGLTFSVEIARQGGKNEMSSHLELWLLADFAGENKNLIKCSPTFKPQTIISMLRLKEKLDLAGLNGNWVTEMGYIIRLGKARAIFLSAEESSNVVGNTAHLLLEVDEAQDVKEEKYSKEFKPMGSTANVTSVLYGTTWDDSTLLEKTKQQNLELERKDGLKRHFRYDWQEVARYNPDYLAYVESEKERLGENHPLFLTQYRLLPIRGGGGFLNREQKARMQGEHSRRRNPEAAKTYIAGIDLAGEAETAEDDFLKALKPGRDSTVITIGELDSASPSKINIVELYSWTGLRHPDLYPRFIDLVKNVWHCRRVVIDATGIGQPVASFLKNELGSRIVPFVFSPSSKTRLAFNLLAAINSGGLKMCAADNSEEYREFWSQMDNAKSFYRPNQTMNFFVDPADGHDDYLMSLALLVEAGNGYQTREAKGHDRMYQQTKKYIRM